MGDVNPGPVRPSSTIVAPSASRARSERIVHRAFNRARPADHARTSRSGGVGYRYFEAPQRHISSVHLVGGVELEPVGLVDQHQPPSKLVPPAPAAATAAWARRAALRLP